MNWDQVALDAVNAGAVQKPVELARFLRAVEEIGPAVIVEIGAASGGTLAAWRRFDPEMLVAIDLPHPYAGRPPLDAHGAYVIVGDSHHPYVAAELVARLKGRGVDLLFIDGDHSEAGVRQDLRYAPLVRPGGIVALHDIVRHPPAAGAIDVWKVWADLKAAHPANAVELVDPAGGTWGGIGYYRRR